jgi:hypothetical protein
VSDDWLTEKTQWLEVIDMGATKALVVDAAALVVRDVDDLIHLDEDRTIRGR